MWVIRTNHISNWQILENGKSCELKKSVCLGMNQAWEWKQYVWRINQSSSCTVCCYCLNTNLVIIFTSSWYENNNFKLQHPFQPKIFFWALEQCDNKKWPNVYQRCPKIISLEKWYIFSPFQKLPKNVGGLCNLIAAKGVKSCPKSNKLPNLVTLLLRNICSNSLRETFLALCVLKC